MAGNACVALLPARDVCVIKAACAQEDHQVQHTIVKPHPSWQLCMVCAHPTAIASHTLGWQPGLMAAPSEEKWRKAREFGKSKQEWIGLLPTASHIELRAACCPAPLAC